MNRKTSIAVAVVAMLAILLVCQASFGEDESYSNREYGLSFPLPPQMKVYTSEHPGPFTFKVGNIFILANKRSPNEFIMVNTSAVNDDKDLQDWKSSLESRDLSQDGYKRISVQYIAIGKNQDKRAVEHIFDMRGQVARTMRQICFVHKGKGFCFTCTANVDKFEQVNKMFFDPVLKSITFE